MASETESMVFDFKSFMMTCSKNMKLEEKQLKAFIHGINNGSVNDFQLCFWLCSFANHSFTLSKWLTI